MTVGRNAHHIRCHRKMMPTDSGKRLNLNRPLKSSCLLTTTSQLARPGGHGMHTGKEVIEAASTRIKWQSALERIMISMRMKEHSSL